MSQEQVSAGARIAQEVYPCRWMSSKVSDAVNCEIAIAQGWPGQKCHGCENWPGLAQRIDAAIRDARLDELRNSCKSLCYWCGQGVGVSVQPFDESLHPYWHQPYPEGKKLKFIACLAIPIQERIAALEAQP